MILGMSVATFTLIHVVLSLIGIASGLIVLSAMICGKRPTLTPLFLATTILTSVTGFLFPAPGFDPPRMVATISLVVLALAVIALYVFALAGRWRAIYVIAATIALYLNCFVGVFQAFQKLSFLRPLAPTQSEPPFIAAQSIVILAFILLGFLGVRRFRPWL